MSKWTDAIELAKAGFKAGEIKKLWEEKENEPEPQREETTQTPEEKTDPAGTDPGPAAETADQETDPPAGDPETDYKRKYEELLKRTQEENIRRDSTDPNQKSLEDQVTEILGGFIGG